jgi:hypothetical protein
MESYKQFASSCLVGTHRPKLSKTPPLLGGGLGRMGKHSRKQVTSEMEGLPPSKFILSIRLGAKIKNKKRSYLRKKNAYQIALENFQFLC